MVLSDKEQMVLLLLSTVPKLEHLNNPIVDKAGYYVGGFVDEWKWFGKDVLMRLSIDELRKLYTLTYDYEERKINGQS